MPLTVSRDGYVRCTYTRLQLTGLDHTISGLDEDRERGVPDTVLSTAITGYTEWVDSRSSLITVGWDWQMNAVNQLVVLSRSGEPRSNLMLVDASGTDIGLALTAKLIGELIDGLPWQLVVRRSIAARYAI